MDWYQVLTIIGSILVPMLSGFGWILHKISSLENRVGQVEQRFSHLEGIFEERGRWEARQIERK